MPYLRKSDFNCYFNTFLLIGLGGMPFFTTGYLWNLYVFIYASAAFILKKYEIDNSFVFYIIFVTVVIIFQAFIFKFLPLKTTLGIYVTFINAYFLLKLIGKDFFRYFVDIIYWLTIVSFVFFVPSLLFPDFEKLLLENIAPFFQQQASRHGYGYNPNFIIYTINTGITQGYSDYSMSILGGRNPAAFYEAGGFGVYAVTALLFNFIVSKQIFNKKGVVIILGVFSTFSTASYIAVFVTIISGLTILKGKSSKMLLLPAALVAFWMLFSTYEFLGKKIDENYQQSIDIGSYYYGSKNRFVSFVFDLYDIQKYPLTGRGVNEETRFQDFSGFNRDTHRNNGISDFAVKFGLPFFVFYFVNIYFSFKAANKKYKINKNSFALLSTAIITLLGFSQVIFLSVTFIALSYFHIILGKDENSMAVPLSG